jgi:hypothetical protein
MPRLFRHVVCGPVVSVKPMPHKPSTVFESIESAREYVGLLCDAVDEAEQAIQQEIARPSALTSRRNLDALRLVDYKLKTLRHHFVVSRRLLTDLRSLRRYLLDERAERVGQRPASAETVDARAF